MQTHFGDPCIHCGLSMEQFEVGACKGDFSKAKVIGYALLESRWDGCQHYRWRTSDNAVHEAWSYPDAHAPYYHFGKSQDLVLPPPYDARLLTVRTPPHRHNARDGASHKSPPPNFAGKVKT